MERLAPVMGQLLTLRTELEQDLDLVNKMIAVAEPGQPKRGWNRKTDREKDEPLVVEPGQQKPRTTNPEVVEALYAAIQARKTNGKSTVQALPGSVTAKELAEETGRPIGAVRTAIQQLERDGRIQTQRMSWTDLGLKTPQASTKVIVPV